MAIKRTSKQKPKWAKICLYISLALIVFAVGLYIYFRTSISSEFGYAKGFYGDTFDELFSMASIDSDISSPILAEARSALTYIGTDTESFGELARYCPGEGADKATCTLDFIAGGMEKGIGYLWVAYTQQIFDADGTQIASYGSEGQRVLSRWTIKMLNGVWTVTEISQP